MSWPQGLGIKTIVAVSIICPALYLQMECECGGSWGDMSVMFMSRL